MKIKTLLYTACFIILSAITPTTALLAEETTKKNSDILIQDGELIISKKEALIIIDDMNLGQKKRLLTSDEKLKNLLLDMLILKKRAREAKKKGLDKTPLMQWKINKLVSQMLVRELVQDYKKNLKEPENLESLAKEYYDSHPEEFTSKETVKVAHILFSIKKESDEKTKQQQLDKAKKSLEKLQKGEDFAKMAKELSEDPGSASSGGEMDFFAHGAMVKPFELASFSLKEKDTLSNIVETRFGYHIIKLIEHKDAAKKPFQEVKNNLISQQKRNYLKQKATNYINSFGVDKNTIVYIPAIEKLLKEQTSKLPEPTLK